MGAQLYLPPLDLSWALSAARQSNQLWEPSSISLLLISPAFCQQQDNPTSYGSPALPPSSWSLLCSVSNKTFRPAMGAQLYLPPLDLSWALSEARQSNQLWEPSSTSLLLISPGLCQKQDNPTSYESPALSPSSWSLLGSVSSKTIQPAMGAQLYLPPLDLSCTLLTARHSVQLWEPSSTSLLLISPGLCVALSKSKHGA